MPAFVLNLHAQRQAHRRGISFEDIDYVLSHYDTRRPARILPGHPPAEIYIATVRDRRLRVYIELDSAPFNVTTAAWEDR